MKYLIFLIIFFLLGRALFIARSNPGSKKCESIEHHIEQHYLGEGYHHNNKYSPLKSTDDRRYRLLCYRTKGTVSPDRYINNFNFIFLKNEVIFTFVYIHFLNQNIKIQILLRMKLILKKLLI